jgi:hypothetical protein
MGNMSVVDTLWSMLGYGASDTPDISEGIINLTPTNATTNVLNFTVSNITKVVADAGITNASISDTVLDIVAYQSIGDVVSKYIITPLSGVSSLPMTSMAVSAGVVGGLGVVVILEAPKAYDAFKRRNWGAFTLHGAATVGAGLRIAHEVYFASGNLAGNLAAFPGKIDL